MHVSVINFKNEKFSAIFLLHIFWDITSGVHDDSVYFFKEKREKKISILRAYYMLGNVHT